MVLCVSKARQLGVASFLDALPSRSDTRPYHRSDLIRHKGSVLLDGGFYWVWRHARKIGDIKPARPVADHRPAIGKRRQPGGVSACACPSHAARRRPRTTQAGCRALARAGLRAAGRTSSPSRRPWSPSAALRTQPGCFLPRAGEAAGTENTWAGDSCRVAQRPDGLERNSRLVLPSSRVMRGHFMPVEQATQFATCRGGSRPRRHGPSKHLGRDLVR